MCHVCDMHAKQHRQGLWRDIKAAHGNMQCLQAHQTALHLRAVTGCTCLPTLWQRLLSRHVIKVSLGVTYNAATDQASCAVLSRRLAMEPHDTQQKTQLSLLCQAACQLTGQHTQQTSQCYNELDQARGTNTR